MVEVSETSETPNVQLDQPSGWQQTTLRNLWQLYTYEFATIKKFPIEWCGRWSEVYLDGCFPERGSRCSKLAFLISREDLGLCGFAVVIKRRKSKLSDARNVNDLDQFFILPHARRHGIGREAACMLFDRFSGDWEVYQVAENDRAIAFWRSVIGGYTGGNYTEQEVTKPKTSYAGVFQNFTSPHPDRATGRQ